MRRKKTKDIWVVGDLRNEKLFGLYINALGKAREIARSVSGKVAAVLIGSSNAGLECNSHGEKTYLPVEPAANESIAYGADYVYIIDDPRLAVPRADTFAAVLADTVIRRDPMFVMFALTDFGRELAARAARITNAGLIAQCMDIRIEQGKVVAKCPSSNKEVIAEITFSEESRTGFVILQPTISQTPELPGDPGNVEWIKADHLTIVEGPNLLSSSPWPKKKGQLEDADAVVIGGGGLRNAEDFNMARELAATLGGEIGATRPPVLQNWVEEERLVGQTGKTIRPRLLLSVGTSGAIQYTSGIKDSKVIVAINRDKDSPIFKIADLGIVADAKTFLPLLINKVKEATAYKKGDIEKYSSSMG